MKKTKALLCTFLLCAPLTVVAADVEINETNFPDAIFRAYLLRQDYGRDGILTEAEIKGITTLYVNNQNIGSLKGVEYFTALTNLQCYNNQLTSLDVSGCKSLTAIHCNNNKINGEGMDTFINSLPEKTAGEWANIYIYNALKGEEGNVCTSAQVAAIKAKGWYPLYCTEIDGNTSRWSEYSGNDDDPSTPDDNPSTPDGIAIDEANFPDANFRAYLLRQDYGRDGILTEAEIKGITTLYVNNQNIGSLKGVEYFTALTNLQCSDNQLTALDVSNNTSLALLYCYNNQLTTLDVSNTTALTLLYCSNNQLTALDVSNNPALTFLYCEDNQLTALDVSSNTALTELWCGANQLTALDASKNTALAVLSCAYNQLTTLYVSENAVLTKLFCYSNQIKDESMDAFISGLPENTDGELYLRYESSPDEGSVMTKSQVAATKAKGWIPYYWDIDADMWMEYEGIDEEVSGITSQKTETERVDNTVYTLSGQKVTTPVKGGVYIINGKKVVVK